MDIRERLKSQYNDLGFEVSDIVLDKCVEICVLHNIEEEEFVETWMAFSLTHLKGAPPTTDTLVQMERKEFSNLDKVASTSSTSSCQPTTPLTIYNKTPTRNNKLVGEKLNQLDATPKGTKTINLLSKHLPTSGSKFSPASFSPTLPSSSGKYSARTNAGEVVAEFSERSAGDWMGKEKVALTVGPYKDENPSSNNRIMMEPLAEKAAILNDVIERIGSRLVDINKLEEPSDHREINMTEVVCVGRICCDSNERLNITSVLLEGSLQQSNGLSISLDLSHLPHFALFPGQVVAVVGINPTRHKFIVHKLYTSACLPQPSRLPRFTRSINIVIAAGPFTPSDSQGYEPLEDLMQYVQNHKPHALILIGPLVDLRQAQHTSGSLAESFDALYDKILKGIVEQLKGSWTHVVVVSSSNDATCLPVYPTPVPRDSRANSHLHLMSDPSLLSINGLVIGLTATDTLMHLGKEEISVAPGGSDRLGRLASHLIQQQNFYPLYPSSEEVSVDYDLWDSLAPLPVTPHVLVVPSCFRYFIKHLHGCLVVNPEHLSKGTTGGTFARLEVEPPTDDAWTPATHISAQILKI